MQGIDEKVPGSAAKRAAGFPFSRSPGHSRAPVAAPGSVFTRVHTQPQGSLFPTWSYSGILGKVNSSSPQTLLRGLRARAPIALQAPAAAPGRKAGLGRRSGAPSGRRSGNRSCRPGETAGPPEALGNSPLFLGLGTVLMSPESACLCGQAPSCCLPWLTRFNHDGGPSPGPYKREPSSLSGA